MQIYRRLAVMALLTTGAHAQWLHLPTPGIPRLPDGKPNLTAPVPRSADGKPDLTGLWAGFNGVADLKLSDAQPWARALVQQRTDTFGKDNPRYLCLPEGPTASDAAGVMRRILQTSSMIAILHEDLTYRQIFMDGRKLETDPSPSWMGYSVGRWDGDTLVVESAGFNDRTWLGRDYPHTETLRMTERYQRIDFGHLKIEARLEDPTAYSRPWTFHATAQLAADTEMSDTRCDPADAGRQHWTGNVADAQSSAVKLTPEILAKYVGVYKGVWARRPRVVEFTLSANKLFVAFEGGEPQPLVPQSETDFNGTGLGYHFNRDDHGVATDVIEIHVSGNYKLQRQR
jgi:hypothetical protein